MFTLIFFFNDTATTEIYTLSLHDALPISGRGEGLRAGGSMIGQVVGQARPPIAAADRKSTRLNSSHSQISYAVFCLKKKNGYKHFLKHCKLWCKSTYASVLSCRRPRTLPR